MAIHHYRGFGLSEGEPSESVVLEDAGLIYDYAAARSDVDPSSIVVLGRSLGTYFAVSLATTRQIRGAILATPFDSFAALAAERYPWLPVGRLLNGRYDAAAIAPAIKVPALFILAEHDDVTRLKTAPARARVGRTPAHCEAGGRASLRIERREEFWNALAEFLREIESTPPR